MRGIVALTILITGVAIPAEAQSFLLSSNTFPTLGNGQLTWADYDGDGDLDFLYAGFGAPNVVNQLFRNDGTNGFVVAGNQLFGIKELAAAWGDFDNDGDLDLAVSGLGGDLTTRIYRQEASGVFADTGAGAYMGGLLTWGDLDNDGRLDLIVSGQTARYGQLPEARTEVYRNDRLAGFKLAAILPVLGDGAHRLALFDYDGDGRLDLNVVERRDEGMAVVTRRNDGQFGFVIREQVLTNAFASSSAWGDYDNDGALDLVLIPDRPDTSAGVFRNDHGTLTQTAAVPLFRAGYIYPSIARWVDFDGDGRLDIATSGNSFELRADITFLLRQGPNGTFTNVLHNLPGLHPEGVSFDVPGLISTTLDWVDVDHDGTLDPVLAGWSGFFDQLRMEIYYNQAAPSNPPPSAPESLQASVDGSSVRFGWSPPVDPNQDGGLTYNLRVGTQPVSANVLSPMSDLATGRRLLPTGGNAGTATTWTLTNLLAGTYYWSVQAVDNGWAASRFAPEAQLTVPPGPARVGETSVSNIVAGNAVLIARGIPNGSDAAAWFEFGTSAVFGNATAPQAIGRESEPVEVRAQLGGLAIATNHFCRLVISNALGPVFGETISFYMTNTPPELAGLRSVRTAPGRVSPTQSFLVNDLETLPDMLIISASSSNTNLIGPDSIMLDGTGTNRTVAVLPLPNQRGTATIQIVVTDQHGGATARTFSLRVEDFSTQLVVTLDTGSGGVHWGDFDRDGDLDLIYRIRPRVNLGGTNFPSAALLFPTLPNGPLDCADVNLDNLLDVAATSGAPTQPASTVIITNRGSPAGFFTLAALPGFSRGAISFADVDNDGDPDLLLCGLSNQTQIASSATRLFRNDRTAGFAELAVSVPPLREAAAAWADMDGDGDLDLAVTGSTNRVGTRPVNRDGMTAVFRNDDGTLTDLLLPLRSLSGGSIAWGDLDNDGLPDLLAVGADTNTPARTFSVVYRNLGGTNLEEFASLRGYTTGRGIWADFDNDGYLDILITGVTNVNNTFAADSPSLYLNQRGTGFIDIGSPLPGTRLDVAAGDFNGDGILDLFLGDSALMSNFEARNPLPRAPDALASEVSGDRVRLRWSPGADSNQSGGHTFNLRVGTTPGGVDVMSPLADGASGFRYLVRRGNAGEGNSWLLRGLAPGKYYWSVQAIDNAYAGSPFAPEASFVIEEPTLLRFAGVAVVTPERLRVSIAGAEEGAVVIEASEDLQHWVGISTNTANAGALQLELDREGRVYFFLRAHQRN